MEITKVEYCFGPNAGFTTNTWKAYIATENKDQAVAHIIERYRMNEVTIIGVEYVCDIHVMTPQVAAIVTQNYANGNNLKLVAKSADITSKDAPKAVNRAKVVNEDGTPKRIPGRPKKEESEEAAVTRGPGRPKKEPFEDIEKAIKKSK